MYGTLSDPKTINKSQNKSQNKTKSGYNNYQGNNTNNQSLISKQPQKHTNTQQLQSQLQPQPQSSYLQLPPLQQLNNNSHNTFYTFTTDNYPQTTIEKNISKETSSLTMNSSNTAQYSQHSQHSQHSRIGDDNNSSLGDNDTLGDLQYESWQTTNDDINNESFIDDADIDQIPHSYYDTNNNPDTILSKLGFNSSPTAWIFLQNSSNRLQYSKNYLIFYSIVILVQIFLLVYILRQYFAGDHYEPELWYLIADFSVLALLLFELTIRIVSRGRLFFYSLFNIIDCIIMFFCISVSIVFMILPDVAITTWLGREALIVIRCALQIFRIVSIVRSQVLRRTKLASPKDTIVFQQLPTMADEEDDFPHIPNQHEQFSIHNKDYDIDMMNDMQHIQNMQGIDDIDDINMMQNIHGMQGMEGFNINDNNNNNDNPYLL